MKLLLAALLVGLGLGAAAPRRTFVVTGHEEIRVDGRNERVVTLEPMLVPQIGVEPAGDSVLNKGDVLHCESTDRPISVKTGSGKFRMHIMVLDCGHDGKLIVRGIQW